VPVIIRVLDVLAIITLCFALTIFLTGGFREFTPFGRVSITSWVRPLAVALVVIALRHWWWPRPTLFARAWLAVRSAWATSERRLVLPIVISTRGSVFLVGFFAIVLVGYRTDIDVPWRVYTNEILNLPARWDTGWYLGVAIEGYRWNPALASQQQNIAFFPLYPMLMRYGSLLLGRETMWTGVLISWIAFFGALVYLYRFARERMGDDPATAGLALLACYPFAVFFSTTYPESLFLLTLVAACYHFERDELWHAAVWGLAAGLTRPNGCLLFVVLALMTVYRRRTTVDGRRLTDGGRRSPVERTLLARRLAVAAAPGIGMLVYSTYIYFLTGNPLQWVVQNPAWGEVHRSLDSLVTLRAQPVGEAGLYSFAATRAVNALQLTAAVFVLGTVWPVFRRFGLPYAALIVINVVPPLMMGGLSSMGRVTSVLFPMFLWLGSAIPPNHRTAWLAIFAMLQALCAAMFFTWRPL
jgi:Mannosyltransferase (PIG-V)